MFSGQVDENCSTVRVTLHVFVSNEHLNLGLDHARVRLEHSDVANDIRDKGLEGICLLSLHDLYTMCLDDKLTFFHDLLLLRGLFRSSCNGLLLVSSNRH